MSDQREETARARVRERLARRRQRQGARRGPELIAIRRLQRLVVACTWGARVIRLGSDSRGAEPTAVDAIRSTTEWPLRTADRLRLRGGRRRREVRDLRNPAPPLVASETDGERNCEEGDARGGRARGRAQRSPLHRSRLYITLHGRRASHSLVAREKRSPRRPRCGTPTEFKELCGDRP
ncbi:unnamed protein product [Chrysodeixis includens]|uniref:Uncharacterized protein n=1 Tax=Chrysodeixis includens TaxID=689277 RepID=A0A9N8L4W1_CHRIL|nr:unnamed protein product [Chrysodeixis includens]